MNAQRAKAFIADFDKVFELLAERSTDAEEINQMIEYPEIFDFNVMETEGGRIVNDETLKKSFYVEGLLKGLQTMKE